jgi:hypothetical protein
MQVNLTIISVVACISSITANGDGELPSEIRDVGLATCEKIYGLMAYPRVIQNIIVLRTSPLRVRVHLLAQDPSTSITTFQNF